MFTSRIIILSSRFRHSSFIRHYYIIFSRLSCTYTLQFLCLRSTEHSSTKTRLKSLRANRDQTIHASFVQAREKIDKYVGKELLVNYLNYLPDGAKRASRTSVVQSIENYAGYTRAISHIG